MPWRARCSFISSGNCATVSSETMAYRASGLNLVVNAIILWNAASAVMDRN